jgi:hypothetical protein
MSDEYQEVLQSRRREPSSAGHRHRRPIPCGCAARAKEGTHYGSNDHQGAILVVHDDAFVRKLVTAFLRCRIESRVGLAILTRQTTCRRPKLEWGILVQPMGVTTGPGEPGFSVQVFLSKVGTGRTLADHRSRQVIFSQGDTAGSIFYIYKGKVS